MNNASPAASTAQIFAVVNGVPRRLTPGATLADLVTDLGLDASRLAIELNRRIVKAAAWPHTEIDNAAQIEIVQFVGGG